MLAALAANILSVEFLVHAWDVAQMPATASVWWPSLVARRSEIRQPKRPCQLRPALAKSRIAVPNIIAA